MILVLLTAGSSWLAPASAQQGPVTWPTPAASVRRAVPPAVFLPERDGTGEVVGFRSRHAGTQLRITKHGVDVLLVQEIRGEAVGRLVRLGFPGSAADVFVQGMGSPRGVAHAFVGNDPSAWTHEECFERVVLRGLRPGLDLSLTLERSTLAFRLDVGPEGDPTSFRMEVDSGGVEVPVPIGTGESFLTSADGLLRITPPVVSGADPERGSHRQLDWSRNGRMLRLPPTAAAGGSGPVEWTTFLGGNDQDFLHAAARDQSGRLTVAGRTRSLDFPTTPGAFQVDLVGTQDAFVCRFDGATGMLEYSTLLGGAFSGEYALRLAQVGGDVIVTGHTASTDFPTTPGAFDETLTLGSTSTFVTRFADGGASLVYSTILGDGGQIDRVAGLDLAPNGDVVVAGYSTSSAYPTTPGAFQTTDPNGPGTNFSGFVSRLDATGSTLIASSFLGGSTYEQLEDVVVEPDGSVVIIGSTRSADLPVTPGVLGPTLTGPWDAFVARLSPDLSSLHFLTYLGGLGTDKGYGIALGPSGELVVAGVTVGTGFPTTPGAFDPVGVGITDNLFVAKLTPDGREVLYGTYVGGNSTEGAPLDLHVDSAGAVTVAAQTHADNFPTTPGSFQPVPASVGASGDEDGIVFRLHPDGHSLLYSTYLGGSLDELDQYEKGLAVAPDGSVFATTTTTTTSGDFPGVNPGVLDPTFDGPTDGTITFLGMLPTGAVRYGTSSSAGGPPLTLGVLSMPQVGNHGFGITCTNAPPFEVGYLLLAGSGLVSPVPLAGASAWIDPATLILVRRPTSNGLGWSQLRVPIPELPSLVGATVSAQSFWPAGVGRGSFLASDALELTIQP